MPFPVGSWHRRGDCSTAQVAARNHAQPRGFETRLLFPCRCLVILIGAKGFEAGLPANVGESLLERCVATGASLGNGASRQPQPWRRGKCSLADSGSLGGSHVAGNALGFTLVA